MKKGFTLLELLVVITIVVIMEALTFGVIKSQQYDSNEPLNPMIYPREAQAQALQRQNELLERQIQLLEKQQNPNSK